MTVPVEQFKKHLEINRKAWDAYQPVWAEAVRRKRSDREKQPESGHDGLDPLEIEMFGDVPGYQSDLQAVEFPHTLSDFVNAMAQAGSRKDRLVETEERGPSRRGMSNGSEKGTVSSRL